MQSLAIHEIMPRVGQVSIEGDLRLWDAPAQKGVHEFGGFSRFLVWLPTEKNQNTLLGRRRM
jgi:hypothetical protein